jgi:uncharacterized protein
MATTYKTPGVFVEEIPKLPPSVAQVETAIPAFIGYSEKSEKNGESLKAKPTRLSSLVEFETYFGGAYRFNPGDLKVLLDEANNFAVKSVAYTQKVFFLHDAMRLFFDNGGGDCYVVSVDTYANAGFTSGQLTNSNALKAGLDEVEKYDEPTILLFPDAVSLSEDEFYPLQQAALAQCGKLQDRVAVLDLRENKESNWDDAYTKFRDKIGISNLKYGAAYTPWVYSSYARVIDYKLIRNTATVHAIRNAADSADLDLSGLTTNPELNAMVLTASTATDDLAMVAGDAVSLEGASKSINDRYSKLKSDLLAAVPGAPTATAFDALMGLVRALAETFPTWRKTDSARKFINPNLVKTLDAAAKDPANGLRMHAKALIAFEKNTDVIALVGAAHDYAPGYQSMPDTGLNSWLGITDITSASAAPAGLEPLATDFGATATDAEKRAAIIKALAALDPVFNGLSAFFDAILAAASTYQSLAQDALYANHPIVGNIVKSLKKEMSKFPPSSTVAGIYARVDNARGVWKAPANESVNSIIGPTVQITSEKQGNLNVDAVAGKSINAIRTFTGKGTLVWGARTLAGNDNEWRYISVRRFFNMVEESSKKSTEPFVFEPNDANTWVKVQGMLENFLTVLWRQGALQGAKPEHAFYVAVGLGKTMTSLDILEGRMIVEIGMAVVRPAEFIILRFSHKLAES